MIFGLIGFMVLHNILDLRKKLKSRKNKKQPVAERKDTGSTKKE